MSHYVHLARHAKPSSGGQISGGNVDADGNVYIGGRKWDLRTGTKSGFVPGFDHGRDGRYLSFVDGKLTLVHSDGRRVPLDVPVHAGPRYTEFVGPYLALTINQDPGLTILDGDGKRLGVIPQSDSLIFGPFNPHDGKTIWTQEQHQIAQWDVATQRARRTIAAPDGKQFTGLAVLPDGHVATFLRDAVMQKREDDRLTVIDAGGELRSIDQAGMGIAALGADKLVICDDKSRRFIVYNAALEKLDEVEMFEPGRDPFATIVALPSGREWISIGYRGEWDHYGEPGLGGGGVAASPKPAAKKAAAKKPASKKR